MDLPICPLDVTYCSNTSCGRKDCERHPVILKKLRDSGLFQAGCPISVADFSGTCRDYIRDCRGGRACLSTLSGRL